ncbi:MAG: pyruvate kinase [Rhodothalassiaceae bacterium]|nr:MAG: pyruvate kinase [Rhodothalassiaceae bacterium]
MVSSRRELFLKRARRRTRIIATLGPASGDPEMIEALWAAGVDVFRLNMSHGAAADKEPLVAAIRALEEKMGRPIAIMADLQGPKLRVGRFKGGGADLAEGARFVLDLDPAPGDDRRAPLPHPEIFQAARPGTELLLDDGRIRLKVLKASRARLETEVVVGGRLTDNKGVNLPGVVLPVSSLTDKDMRDLEWALDQGVDWIAQSFVQRASDVAETKKLIAGRAGLLAKIEKPSAVADIAAILEIADAVMVARGDLGVEIPLEEVPGIQRRIVRLAREAGKPVVVATQMLESMVHSPMPTRAEVSDVAHAVESGADAIMLSAETAVGEYPVEAVKIMHRVALQVEQDPAYGLKRIAHVAPTETAEDAITAAARQVAETVHAKAIVTFTTSGSTALRAARERPQVPILVLTPKIAVARRLCLAWGLFTVKTRDVTSFEEMAGKAKRMALRHGLAEGGDRIAITAGFPFGTPGATNLLHLAFVTGDELRHRRG